MITGIDTNGEVITSLLQENSNSHVMELFFSHLIHMLDSKNKNWRRDTLIMLDNAPYHTSKVMMNFFE